MKKIHLHPLIIFFVLILNSSLMIISLENQDTNVYDEKNSLKTGDQSENHVFLDSLTLDEIENLTQESIEYIRSAEEDEEDDEDEPEDDDGDGIDDETENLNKRLIDVEYSENQAHIKSELHSGFIKDKIEIELQAEDEGLRIKVDYSKDIKNNDYDLEFEILFSTLIEFIDNNNDSIFTENQDTLLDEITLDSFNDFQYSFYLIENTTYMHYFKISTTDGNLIFHIFFVEEYY